MIRLIIIMVLLSSSFVFGKCRMPKVYYGEIDLLKSKLSAKSDKIIDADKKIILLNILKKAYSQEGNKVKKVSFNLPYRDDLSPLESVLYMKINLFRRSVVKHLSHNASWRPNSSASLSNSSVDKVRSLEAIGEESYLKGWFYLSAGFRDEAIKNLKKSFDYEYKKAIKVTSTRNSLCGSTPQFYWLKKTYKALDAITSGSEREEIKKKYREAQLHITSVPHSRILT